MSHGTKLTEAGAEIFSHDDCLLLLSAFDFCCGGQLEAQLAGGVSPTQLVYTLEIFCPTLARDFDQYLGQVLSIHFHRPEECATALRKFRKRKGMLFGILAADLMADFQDHPNDIEDKLRSKPVGMQTGEYLAQEAGLRSDAIRSVLVRQAEAHREALDADPHASPYLKGKLEPHLRTLQERLEATKDPGKFAAYRGSLLLGSGAGPDTSLSALA